MSQRDREQEMEFIDRVAMHLFGVLFTATPSTVMDTQTRLMCAAAAAYDGAERLYAERMRRLEGRTA